MGKIRWDSRGFTLIELLLIVAIIAVVVGIATPQISNMRQDFTLRAASRDLLSRMQSAKLEAVKRNANVAIVFTTGDYTAAGGVGGYEIFVDNGEGGGTANNFSRDGAETLLSADTMPPGITLLNPSGGVITTFPGKSAGFNFRGLPLKIGNVAMQNRNAKYNRIVVSTTGIIRLQSSSDGLTFE